MYTITVSMLKVKDRDENGTPNLWTTVYDDVIGVCKKKAFAEVYIYNEAQRYLVKHNLIGDKEVEVHEMCGDTVRIDHGDTSMMFSYESVICLD